MGIIFLNTYSRFATFGCLVNYFGQKPDIWVSKGPF